MERLTKWVDCNGKARYGYCADGNCKTTTMCGICGYLDKILTRLAEYEDSGLTPEEVIQLKSDMELMRACFFCKHNRKDCYAGGSEEQKKKYADCALRGDVRRNWVWRGIPDANH